MKISIGREAGKSRLHLTVVDDQGKVLRDVCVGAEQSVHQSVSRQHLQLELQDDGTILLENIKMQNITYVNGTQVHRKAVRTGDKIEMGTERYLLDWKLVKSLLPQMFDIRNLKNVFEDYRDSIKKLNKQQAQSAALKSITGVFSMGAIAVGIFFGKDGDFSALTAVLYGTALITTIFFFVKSWRDADRIPELRDKIQNDFQHTCVCPNEECRHYLGNYSFYDNLPKQCPHCHAKYIK